MPQTAILVYRKPDGTAPRKQWLADLKARELKAYDRCVQRILNLEQLGSELRRPLADMLRDGIRELRIKVGTVNYRILYFFCGSNVACLSHGFTKEAKVSDKDIALALKRKKLVESDPEKYTEEWEE